jgi:hypothetical protein
MFTIIDNLHIHAQDGQTRHEGKCAIIQPSPLNNMLIASRADEAEVEAEAEAEAVVEQTIHGEREQTRTTSIVTIRDWRRTTMDSKWWARRSSKSSGKPCDVTYPTASDLLALKCNTVQMLVARWWAELTFL